MKTLIIYPNTGNAVYSLLDAETGEVLAQHISSNSRFAMSDLVTRRPERIAKWKERFGDDFKVKFADESFNLAESVIRNKKFVADQDTQNGI